MTATAPIPGLYRHYKGQPYRVLGTARHSETMEPLVVYQALYGAYGLWVRPAAMFVENVSVDGRLQPRFALERAVPGPADAQNELDQNDFNRADLNGADLNQADQAPLDPGAGAAPSTGHQP
jgi:hypothetical protein